jgi:hypothetical protein
MCVLSTGIEHFAISLAKRQRQDYTASRFSIKPQSIL